MKKTTRKRFLDGLHPGGMILAMHGQGLSTPYRVRGDAGEYSEESKPAIDFRADGITVIDIHGPLEHRSSFWWDSYDAIRHRFRKAITSSKTRAVLLKIDSPGGDTDGLNEMVDELKRLKRRTKKPVWAFVDEMCASAAYAIATSADKIFLPRAAQAGSIGVYSYLFEQTAADKMAGQHFELFKSGKYKAEGQPHVPLSDSARKNTQNRVNELAQLFFGIVAEARPLTAQQVEGLQARIFTGKAAVKAGLADAVMSYPACLALLRKVIAGDETALDGTTGTGKQNRTGTSGTPGTSVHTNPQAQGSGMNPKALRKKIAGLTQKLAAEENKAKRKAISAKISKLLALVGSPSTSAKNTFKKKTTEVEETSDEDEEEEEEESADDADEEEEESADDMGDGCDEDEEEEEEESASADDSDDSDDSDDDDDDDDGDDDSDDSDSKSLARYASQLTGKKSISAIKGALRAMADTTTKTHKLAARAARDIRAVKVKELVSKGRKAGQIAPAQVAFFTEMGMRSKKELKAYLETAPKRVARPEDAMLPLELKNGEKMAVTKDQMKMAETMANALGKTVDEVLEMTRKSMASMKANGVAVPKN